MRDNMISGVPVFGKVTFDLTTGAKKGLKIGFSQIPLPCSDASEVPQSVKNWDFFKGSIVPFAIVSKTSCSLTGTAVFVAPGLAIIATHTFIDHIDEIGSGALAAQCFGIREKTCDIWSATSISVTESDDIAFLSMEPISEMPDDNYFYNFGITTRTPRVGEELQIVGFRDSQDLHAKEHTFSASLYVSKGVVKNVHTYRRDNFLINYPCIELACGSLGGMSGGACIDKNGLVMGVISRGLESPDMEGPTYVSWVTSALGRKVTLKWPPGIYSDPIRIIDIKPPLIYIDRRDSIKIVSDETINYRSWY